MARALFAALLFSFLGGCSKTQVDPQDAGDDAQVEAATTTSSVQIIVEPSDNAQALLTSIQSATTSIHMTMYLLTSSTFVNALIAKKKAGLDVKVVLNQTFPTTGTDNNAVFAQLQAAGVPVVWASAAFNYTHEKAVIVDGTSAWIMTMNVTFSSPTSNREYLALDTDPDDVAEAEAIFQADFANTSITPTGKLLVAPVNARDGLVALIQNATTTVDLEGESLSDFPIVSALTAAHDRGVAVRVVLSDSTPTSAMANAVALLVGDGIPVKKLSTPYVHAKAIVADNTVAYVGSANFTQNSLDSNRELGVLASEPSGVAKVAATIDGDFTAGVVY
jgi:cardiolipin synthase A/B